ncbi:DUF4259 domain-containing protein [Streptomyces sp. NBC_01571]|uniref:DUF4259 domain-containing protein n=1 Tax=Streptomyces sp. NBC_01571 TaxID=2975883 RepID=UPI002B1CDEEB|nr:DUF4259 domain-containing protein [Streptomyces sp. NBC_01571]
MGTWDIGLFCFDTAADFANALDDAGPEACGALIRGVLVRTVGATGYLREADEVVAAAALIAAQCPGGQPVVDTPYGPETPMPGSLPTFGRSLTKPSPASPATKLGRPRSGSIRRTEASLRTEGEPEPENGLHMVTTSRGVQPGRSPASRLLTNRPLSKPQVLAHPRRKINTDQPIQLNRSTRAGVQKRGAGR